MNRFQANLCLVVVAMLWSSEIVIFSVIPDEVPSWATMCISSLIGACLLLPCFARRIAASIRENGLKLIRRAALLSALNATYNALIIISLDYFDVTTGAFTQSMTLIVMPVLLIAMHRRVSARTWASAIIILSGMLIAVTPTFTTQQLPGLAIMFVSCILRAIFIIKLNGYAREQDPMALSAGMVSFNAIISFIPWFIIQPATFTTIPWTPRVIAALFIYAYFCVAFVSVLNIFAQRHATAAGATIIYSTEIVFTTFWVTILPSHIVDPAPLAWTTIAGCALIVLGNVIEIVHSKKPEDEADDMDNATAEDSRSECTLDESRPAPQSGTTSRALAPLKHPATRAIVLFAVLLVVFLVIAIPFKVLVVIPGFTDVRPVSMLVPVYGIFFGIPGCLAFAVGNLIVDIISGDLRMSSIAGFVSSFVYPYLMYLIWTQLRKREFNLRSGRMVAAFCASAFACACLQALIIAPAVEYHYPEVNSTLFALMVATNGTVFPIVLAIPFIILIREEMGFLPLGRRN